MPRRRTTRLHTLRAAVANTEGANRRILTYFSADTTDPYPVGAVVPRLFVIDDTLETVLDTWPQLTVDELIEAIEQRLVLQYTYEGLPRVVIPAAVGISLRRAVDAAVETAVGLESTRLGGIQSLAGDLLAAQGLVTAGLLEPPPAGRST